jgi:fatty acid desaturase
MTISASPESLSPAATRRKRRDAPALIHLAIQIVATLGFASSAAALSSINYLAAWVATVAFGVCVLTFFPLLHEAGHQTAFATSYANEFGVWLGALMMLQAPSFFREFHWEHHPRP